MVAHFPVIRDIIAATGENSSEFGNDRASRFAFHAAAVLLGSVLSSGAERLQSQIAGTEPLNSVALLLELVEVALLIAD